MDDLQSVIRFVSHFPTHSTVWELMEFDPIDNPHMVRLTATGEVFWDREGTYWHAHCAFFTTEDRANSYAGTNVLSRWQRVEVIALTANPVRG